MESAQITLIRQAKSRLSFEKHTKFLRAHIIVINHYKFMLE